MAALWIGSTKLLTAHSIGYSRGNEKRLVACRSSSSSTSFPKPERSIQDRGSFVNEEAQVLAQTEKDLAEFCEYTGNDPRCWKVHDWYVDKWHDAEAQLSLGQPGNDTAEQYHNLQKTMRELSVSGDMETLYTSLSALQHLEEKRQQKAQHTSSSDSPAAPASSDSVARLVNAFNRADANKDGKMTWQEFESALHFLGDDLGDHELECVGKALDLHGRVTLDEFVAIVHGAEEAKMAGDAHFLRNVLHQHRNPFDQEHIPEYI